MNIGVPVLSKIPYVNRLFKNVGIARTTQSLMLMVLHESLSRKRKRINCLVSSGRSGCLPIFPFRQVVLMLKLLCVSGAVLGFLGVAAGSFGAHGLKDLLEANGHAANWETAVRYCLFHAVVLIAIGSLASGSENAGLTTLFTGAAGCFVVWCLDIQWMPRRSGVNRYSYPRGNCPDRWRPAFDRMGNARCGDLSTSLLKRLPAACLGWKQTGSITCLTSCRCMGTKDCGCHKDSRPCELHNARFLVRKKTCEQLIEF